MTKGDLAPPASLAGAGTGREEERTMCEDYEELLRAKLAP